jgi:beta-lactamase class A
MLCIVSGGTVTYLAATQLWPLETNVLCTGQKAYNKQHEDALGMVERSNSSEASSRLNNASGNSLNATSGNCANESSAGAVNNSVSHKAQTSLSQNSNSATSGAETSPNNKLTTSSSQNNAGVNANAADNTILKNAPKVLNATTNAGATHTIASHTSEGNSRIGNTVMQAAPIAKPGNVGDNTANYNAGRGAFASAGNVNATHIARGAVVKGAIQTKSTEGQNTGNSLAHVQRSIVAEATSEAQSLHPLKQEISDYVNAREADGKANSVSVYIRSLNKADWMSYNAGRTYHPASLNKVATLISYMKASESDDKLLDKKISYHSKTTKRTDTSGQLKTLQSGKSYTVKELLHYMIAYSDNEATALLLKALKPENYYRTYTDLGLPKPSRISGNNELSAQQFSVFMKALYFGTYLSPISSEFCNSLLTECDYNDGLLKGIPAGVEVAHKFGEFCDGNNYELHESGIVYIKNNPYIVTIMTKGPDRKQLSKVISELSGIIYKNFASDAP